MQESIILKVILQMSKCNILEKKIKSLSEIKDLIESADTTYNYLSSSSNLK